MTIGAVLLGVINIAIVVALLLLLGVIIEWIMGALKLPPPAQARQIYLVIVALIALYMLVALVLGLPTVRLLAITPSPAATLSVAVAH